MSKSLKDYSKEELLELVQSLKKTKKFGLVWEDKPEQVAIDCETKLPVLQEVEDRAITESEDQPTNLIIEGDNYHSLSTLNYTHAGKIDVIYIDPPYNTGNKDFIYNDRYIDQEDGFRHSKWLSFMSKRLKLAKTLLANDGVIFISIDDNEQAHLKLLCDELFGSTNVEQMIWKKNDFTDGVLKITKRFRIEHEYIIVCYKDKNLVNFNKVLQYSQIKNKYPNPDNDPRGEWISTELGASEAKSKKNSPRYYKIVSPTGKEWYRQWLFDEENMESLIKDSRVYFGKDGNAQPRLKKFVNEKREKSATSILQDYGSARSGARQIEQIFGTRVFDYPKPIELLEYLLELYKNKDATVLDFMAGSGTTGQAVLRSNQTDGGNRKFILCTNNENGIAENITYKRISNVVHGYKDVAGTPANVRYLKTSFVDKAENTDQTRVVLVARATDMIKVRENTFETVVEEDLFKAYEGADTYSVIVFDPSVIDKAKTEITKLSDDKAVRVYVFSLANDSYTSDFADLDRQIELCPIPESILEVYKRIFDQKGTK
jgi:adenine-specific DNA-methyltransferase